MNEPELGNLIFGHSRGEFSVPRREGYEEQLYRLFEVVAPDRDKSWHEYGPACFTDMFEIHPYCWCEEEACPQCGTGEQPNFLYRPTGYELRWYKYPLRDSYANQDLSLTQFAAMIDACIQHWRNQ